MNDGRQGEVLFQHIMKSQNHRVVDVSGDPQYWDIDIDFLVTSSSSGETKSFEVKWDYKINKTNNLYLEVANSHSVNGVGWWEFCKADYIAYGDAINKIFYVFDRKELKERVLKIRQHYTMCKDESIGLLIGLDEVKDIYKILS